MQMTSSTGAEAALLSGLTMAEVTLYPALDTCLPFNGARRLPLLSRKRPSMTVLRCVNETPPLSIGLPLLWKKLEQVKRRV